MKTKLKKALAPQAKRMQKSIREELETWARALEKKYGVAQGKKK